MWEIVRENLKSGQMESCGTYTSLKQGLQYAPEILDCHFSEQGIGIDEKDEKIGEFMQCGGRLAVVAGDWQYFLTKQMFDVYEKKIAEPSGCIRIGGKAKWKQPFANGTTQEVDVVRIFAPNDIRVKMPQGNECVAKHSELKAA